MDALTGRVAPITGGSNGSGRTIALAFAVEGADVAVNYLPEHDVAEDVVREVAAHCQRE